jgi:hypothetical protein
VVPVRALAATDPAVPSQFPEIEPVILLVTDKFVRVPTEVKDEDVKPVGSVVPVMLAAATAPAYPVIDPLIGLTTVKEFNIPRVVISG